MRSAAAFGTLNPPRTQAVLAAAAALAPAPGGFTVADLAARVRAMTGQDGYYPAGRLQGNISSFTTRQASALHLSRIGKGAWP